MQIIKPLRIGHMNKPIPDRPRSRLALTGLVCFDLLNPATLLTEQSMWDTITPELGAPGILDAWMPKRRGEVLVWGHAATANGMAATQMHVSLHVGERIHKTLTVHGDRSWGPTLLSARIGDAVPFTQMPLTYERAFGGPGYLSNPVGQGHGAMKHLDTGAAVALPNLEYATNPLLHPNQEPRPACFLPFNPSWPGRAPKGTYDEAWMKSRSPAMPLDFDWDIYNVAPPDQQLAGYFRGDEEIRLTGFHADHPLIQCRLQGLAMRFFFVRTGSEILEESRAVLDSVCLFPSVLRGVLIYRSELELRKGHEEQDIASVMLACERSDEARSLAYYEEIFRLRSGEERGLHALSDFQLMPAFSEGDQVRLDARRAEMGVERLALQEQKKQWVAAMAASTVGFDLPAGFFNHAGDADKIESPFLTDLDIELGNVNLAEVKQAVSAITTQVLLKSDEARKVGEQLLAKAKLQINAAREAAYSADQAPLLALLAADSSGVDAPSQALAKVVARLHEIAARVDAAPEWPLSEATVALTTGLQQDMLDQTQSLDGAPIPEMLANTQSASLDKISSGPQIAEVPAVRQQFVTSMRALAKALGGEAGTATPTEHGAAPDENENELHSFLQSVGLGRGAGQGQETDSAATSPGKRFTSLIESLRTAPPDQMGAILTSLLSGMPGAKNVDFTPIQTAFQEAAQAQPETLQKITQTLVSPPPASQIREQIASGLDFEQFTALLPSDTQGSKESAAMAQIQEAQKRMASSISAVVPDAASTDGVNWDRFLNSVGVNDTSMKLPVTSPASAGSDEQQAMQRALALASGVPGTYRLGPPLPAETAEESGVRKLQDEFFSRRDEAEVAHGNAMASEFLQAHQDVRQADGSVTAEDRQKTLNRVAAHAQKHSVVPIPLSDEKMSMYDALASSAASGALASSIMRDVLPKGEKMFREGRQRSPVALIARADLTEKIATGVGASVRQDARLGNSLTGRDLAGADLRGAHLAGIDLTGAFLEHADLSGADLSGAQCEGAVFSGACLEEANFRGAFLKGANLGGARAAKSNFSAADLTDANFFQADFSFADLSGAKLGKCNALKAVFTSANLSDSTCQNGLFLEAMLTGANLVRAQWRKAIFIEADLSGSRAYDADLRECVFSATQANACDLSRSRLEGLVSIGSSFKDLIAVAVQANRSSWAQSALDRANFSHAWLEQANFMKTGLNGADFSAALLRRTLFLHASLRGATLAGSQLYEASLRGADLTAANLRFANLHCADLENAVLDRCDLSGSRRIQTIMESPRALTNEETN